MLLTTYYSPIYASIICQGLSTVLYTASAHIVNITNTYVAVGVNVTSTLTINPINQNFTANYSCRASNSIGSTSESSQAQVIIAGNLCQLCLHFVYYCLCYISAVRPTVLAPTEGEVFSVNEGGSLTVVCSASGVITPSIEFQQVPSGAAAGLLPRVAVGGLSAPVQTGDGDSMVSLSLTLTNAEDSDTRNLTCVASIFFGDLNVTFDDSVQFAVGVNSKFVYIYYDSGLVYQYCVYIFYSHGQHHWTSDGQNCDISSSCCLHLCSYWFPQT